MVRPLLSIAVLLTLAVVVPSASGYLQVRSMPDLSSAGFDAGDGVGLYDASSPPSYCLAILDQYTPAPLEAYYMGLRYWAASAGTTGGSSAAVPEPTDCAGMVPGDNVNVQPFELDAGGAFWVDDVLGPSQVASLAALPMTMEYCRFPSAIPGSPGLSVPPMEAFMAEAVLCGGPAGSDALYPAPTGCTAFSLVSVPGSLTGTGPVFLSDGGCNSLEGSPAVDFLARRCADVTLFDTATGVTTNEQDSDFFVVAKDGSLLAWATAMGSAPSSMFPNVSNLEPNVGC